ncbi:MAG: hypothetical protein R3E12_18465 [Candidatus Eisenbacteria bacterium]
MALRKMVSRYSSPLWLALLGIALVATVGQAAPQRSPLEESPPRLGLPDSGYAGTWTVPVQVQRNHDILPQTTSSIPKVFAADPTRPRRSEMRRMVGAVMGYQHTDTQPGLKYGGLDRFELSLWIGLRSVHLSLFGDLNLGPDTATLTSYFQPDSTNAGFVYKYDTRWNAGSMFLGVRYDPLDTRVRPFAKVGAGLGYAGAYTTIRHAGADGGKDAKERITLAWLGEVGLGWNVIALQDDDEGRAFVYIESFVGAAVGGKSPFPSRAASRSGRSARSTRSQPAGSPSHRGASVWESREISSRNRSTPSSRSTGSVAESAC